MLPDMGGLVGTPSDSTHGTPTSLTQADRDRLEEAHALASQATLDAADAHNAAVAAGAQATAAQTAAANPHATPTALMCAPANTSSTNMIPAIARATPASVRLVGLRRVVAQTYATTRIGAAWRRMLRKFATVRKFALPIEKTRRQARKKARIERTWAFSDSQSERALPWRRSV